MAQSLAIVRVAFTFPLLCHCSRAVLLPHDPCLRLTIASYYWEPCIKHDITEMFRIEHHHARLGYRWTLLMENDSNYLMVATPSFAAVVGALDRHIFRVFRAPEHQNSKSAHEGGSFLQCITIPSIHRPRTHGSAQGLLLCCVVTFIRCICSICLTVYSSTSSGTP